MFDPNFRASCFVPPPLIAGRCATVSPSGTLVSSTDEQLADRVVHLGEAVEPLVPQAPQQPALVGDLLWNR